MHKSTIAAMKDMIKSLQDMIEQNNILYDNMVDQLNDDDLDLFAMTISETKEHLEDAIVCYEDAIVDLEKTQEAITPEDLNNIADLANVLDASDDPDLQKSASVLDEILNTFGVDQNKISSIKRAEQDEIEKIRAKYRKDNNIFKVHSEREGINDYKQVAKDAIDAKIKKFRPLEAPLQTRHCPDHPGTSLIRVAEGVYQCPLTKKIYDYNSGYVTDKGNKIPGVSVAEQTKLDYQSQDSMSFSNRDNILNGS